MSKFVIIPLSIILTIVMSTSILLGQTSTRAEFEEFCKAWEGRWIGDLIWTADWPGMGKKGDTVTGYWEARIVADGNALSGVWYAGNGMGPEIWYFDTATKQIKGVGVSSGGSIFNGIMYKKDGKWKDLRTGSIPDGSRRSRRWYW